MGERDFLDRLFFCPADRVQLAPRMWGRRPGAGLEWGS